MNGGFAVVPDGSGQPAALFEELEDALDWALARYGSDAFCIRYLNVSAGGRGATTGSPGPS